ncbi:MAG: helix-turn-helix domain-containing protein [Vicinamibacterales bacterium]
MRAAMSIGSDLRQAGSQRALAEGAFQRTNIRPQALRAIEANDFASLPGDVITRGYLKLYT